MVCLLRVVERDTRTTFPTIRDARQAVLLAPLKSAFLVPLATTYNTSRSFPTATTSSPTPSTALNASTASTTSTRHLNAKAIQTERDTVMWLK
ncbi:hypothetical protein PENSPDRAFT_651450 [Peniophora sp. CONT]|nr:hypothetical protein PENSPDRAFT_651450 [Peniophora sp. CONT]